jgi:FtsH-binding integral membrane protein
MSFEMERIRHIGDMQDARWGAMSKQTFTTRVMPMFGIALGVTAAGVYGGLQMLAAGVPMLALMALAIVELGLVFTSGIWQRKEGLNKVLFFVYALLAGVTMVPLLSFVGAKGGLMLITQALTVTMITFGGLAVYGLVSKRDFSNLGGFIFVGVLALLVTGLLNAFVFQSGALSLVTSIVSVGLFSAFTVYEMSMIREIYADEDYVGAALGLFIAFIGLFQSILQLFGLMSGNDD